jgi:hypothetical protein
MVGAVKKDSGSIPTEIISRCRILCALRTGQSTEPADIKDLYAADDSALIDIRTESVGPATDVG